jgi:hypothetical protein
MKVKDMIKLLSTAPPDAILVIDGFETGYDEVRNLTYINVTKDLDRDPMTGFLDGEFYLAGEEEVSEVAVYIAGV